MGISARDLSAAPSIEGFLSLTFAASVIPSCIPLATMAGTVVSDPGQLWHAGDRHQAVAAMAADAHDDFKKQVDDVLLGHRRSVGQGYKTGGIGRHPNDRMLSFYVLTPAGFDIEYGWGGREIEGDWQVEEYDRISLWGHERTA